MRPGWRVGGNGERKRSEGRAFDIYYIHLCDGCIFLTQHAFIYLMKFYKRKDFRKLHIFSPNTGAWKKLVAVLLKSQPLYISSSVITNRILINILFCYCLLSARKPRSSSLRLKKKEKHKDNISQTGKKLIHVPFKSLFYNHATKCITAAPVSFHFLPLKELCNTSPD